MMSDGDQTLVGERGVSLSGGQKARVSLARALYFDADVYLLDDPLSAVDAAVSRHLFEKCINGYIKSKPRILVTHQLQYLKQADKILVLKEGKVLGLGSYDDLVASGVDFASLLKKEEEDEEEKEEGEEFNKQEEDFDDIPLDIDDIAFIDKKSSFGINVLSKSLDPQAVSLLSRTLSDEEKPSISKSTKSLHVTSVEKLNRRKVDSKKDLAITQSQGNLSVVDHLAFGSVASVLTLDANIAPDFVAPVKEEEKREIGTVSNKVYLQYLWKGGGCIGFFFFVVLNILAQGTYILSDWWLSYWSSQEEARSEAVKDHEELLDQGYNDTNITIPEYDVYFNLYIYTGITLSVFFFGLFRALLTFKLLVNASRSLHNMMFKSVCRSPIFFFDTNPVGRILNRFSKDMGSLDETLPLTMYDFIQCSLVIVSIILVAGFINPWVFIPTTPICIFFFFIRRYYLETSRDVKRLEATTRSPVYSHLSASLNGLHTIRAFGSTEQFIKEYFRHQDLHSEAWFLFLSTSRWFAIRLDWLCALFVSSVAFCSVLAAESLNGGLVGLTLTYAISLMGLFQWGVRQSAEVENQMTSVERVIEYCNLPPEAALESVKDKKPEDSWPRHGIITGQGVKFRYSQDAPYVLKGLNFCVRAKEKVGIVGRTGAGKSSLITMLFRMAEPDGLVQIDGLDITQMGLHDLRSKLSIIPQDPVLFTGTVRRNLDPFSQHLDSALWLALEEVQLRAAVQELPGKLEAAISEGGTNFSVGQRQLICLARAVLRKNKILVIDEATANVDPRTDGLIQQTIRKKFSECSVLTIAHRLNTIMDSDRVMVLSEGNIVEFDEPYTLLQNEDSQFFKMVEQTGPVESKHLLSIAQEAYLSHSQPDPQSIVTDDNHVNPTNSIQLEKNGNVGV